MKKIVLIVSLILLAFVIILNPIVWVLFGSTHRREDVVEQLVYKAIVSKLTQPEDSEEEKTTKLFNYVDTHIFHKTNMDDSPVKTSILQSLIRGNGYCNDQARTLMDLAKIINIKGRLLFLRGYDIVSHHTVCDFYLEGKFRIFDPDFGYIFFSDGKISTFYDIQNKGNKPNSEKLNALSYLNRDFNPEGYFRLYEPNHAFVIAITNYDQEKSIKAKTLDLYFEIFGDTFLAYLQDLYFQLEDVDPFVRARIKHLSFRFKSALDDYNSIIIINPDEFIRSESLFFKAQLFWDMQNYNNSILAFNELLRIYPENRWIHEVYFYLGNSYENLGKFDKAKVYYSKIKSSHTTPAPTRLMHLLRD